jgi:hypothetical protein
MYTTTDGTHASQGGPLDMMAVLSMLHRCSASAPPNSLDCNVEALSQCALPDHLPMQAGQLHLVHDELLLLLFPHAASSLQQP